MPKYELTTADRFRHRHEIEWTTAAERKWQKRIVETWPDEPPEPHVAFELGEWIEHSELLITNHYEPDRIRLYNHGNGWGALFVVVHREGHERPGIPSVYRPELLEHGPTRSYLFSYGPHGEDA